MSCYCYPARYPVHYTVPNVRDSTDVWFNYRYHTRALLLLAHTVLRLRSCIYTHTHTRCRTTLPTPTGFTMRFTVDLPAFRWTLDTRSLYLRLLRLLHITYILQRLRLPVVITALLVLHTRLHGLPTYTPHYTWITRGC